MADYTRYTIELEPDVIAALDRLVNDLKVHVSIEEAIQATIREWLIGAGYLPQDEIEEDSPTEGKA